MGVGDGGNGVGALKYRGEVSELVSVIYLCAVPGCAVPVCAVPGCAVPVCAVPVCAVPVCAVPVCTSCMHATVLMDWIKNSLSTKCTIF